MNLNIKKTEENVVSKLSLAIELLKVYSNDKNLNLAETISTFEKLYEYVETSYFSFFQENLPAVPIEESVTDDYIVCLEDGKKLQMLKRHLKTVYNMSVAQYKERWGLPTDYPVVSPSYARRRSQIAKETGLGNRIFHDFSKEKKKTF